MYDVVTGTSGIWTDGGAVTYLTSLTDDVGIGGTGPEAPFYFDEGNGQLALSTTGSSAGLSIGGDTQLYRNAANVLRTPDALVVDGNVGIGTTSPATLLDINGDSVRVRTSQTPASNGTGVQGEIAWDASYIYVCTATNTWKRAALTGGY